MVGGKPAFEGLEPLVETEGSKVIIRKGEGRLEGIRTDGAALLGCRQAKPRVQALPYGLITPGSAEQEVDRRKQTLLVQAFDNLAAPGSPCRTASAIGPTAASTVVRGAATLLLRQSDELRVHHALVGEQVVHPGASHDVLPQRNRTVLLHDDGGVAANRLQPGAELLGVADGGRERDDGDGGRKVDDHLLPHRTAEPVRQVVNLVHDDEAEAVEGAGVRVEHVAEHLGRHDDDRRLAVDAVVAGEQSHGPGAVPLDEVVVLLVGEGLDRGRVEALQAAVEGKVDRELPHECLAGSCRRRDEHA